MKDIIDYYEDGGPSTGTAQQKQAYQDRAEDWMEKLKAEFYDNAIMDQLSSCVGCSYYENTQRSCIESQHIPAHLSTP